MNGMTNSPEASYCDSCVFRQETIRTLDGPKNCPQRAMDMYAALGFIWAGLGGPRIQNTPEGTPTVESVQMDFSADHYLAIVACQALVQRGGAPDLNY
jgi:hypothetical protein